MQARFNETINEIEWVINDIVENGNSRHAGQYIPAMRMALDLLKEQKDVIEKYKQADTFLTVHGWNWD